MTTAYPAEIRPIRNAQNVLTGAELQLSRAINSTLRHARQHLLHIQQHEFFRRPLDRVNQLRQVLDDRQRAMIVSVGERLRRARERISRLEARLRERHPRHLIGLKSQKIESLSTRLTIAVAQSIKTHSQKLDLLGTRLNCVNPQEILKRGYSLTTHKKTGQIIRDPSQVKPGEILLTRLASGQIESTVQDTRQLRLFE